MARPVCLATLRLTYFYPGSRCGCICALVEAKWNLPAMTYRDANAGNLLDMVDLRHPAFLRPPRLAKPLLDTDPSSQKCSVTGPGHIRPPGSISPPP
jgi:phospholipase C